MPTRKYQSSSPYRYGFNGKENDNETVGTGEGTQDYGMRIYNPSLGKFLSVDPLSAKYPELTPYQFASNTPIIAADLDGLEADVRVVNLSDGNGNYSPRLGQPDEIRMYNKVAEVAAAVFGQISASGITYIHTSPNGIEAISFTFIDPETKEIKTYTIDGVMIGIVSAKAEQQMKMEDDATAAIEVFVNFEGEGMNSKNGGFKNNNKFNSKANTKSSSPREAFRNAKDRNGIPRSQQPENVTKVDEEFKGKKTGKKLNEYNFTNSSGKKVTIRKDNPVKYNDGGKGDQGQHYNAGETGGNLKQHHDVIEKE